MECLSSFPFRKLINDKYLTLEVLMFVNHEDAYKFMFALNKEAKKFIVNNFIMIRNGFINDGLIEFCFRVEPLM